MSVLSSRRFWAFLVAQILAIITLIVNHFAADPFATQISTLVISTVEGLAGILIAAYTTESTLTARREIEAKQAVDVAKAQTDKPVIIYSDDYRPDPQPTAPEQTQGVG